MLFRSQRLPDLNRCCQPPAANQIPEEASAALWLKLKIHLAQMFQCPRFLSRCYNRTIHRPSLPMPQNTLFFSFCLPFLLKLDFRLLFHQHTMHNHQNRANTNKTISNIKCRPMILADAEIKKIKHRAQTHAVNHIAQRAADNKA